MALSPLGYFRKEDLAAEIERVIPSLGPEVVRVRYNTGTDWSDEPAINFRIVLTDAASKPPLLDDVARRVDRILFDELRPYDWGMRLYTSFRSQSEQAARDGIDLDWT